MDTNGVLLKTGMDFAKWLVESDLDHNGSFLAPEFDFYVHSQNPQGKANIEGLLRQYLGTKFRIA